MKQGKKAGPRKVDPETFIPVVWVAEGDGSAFLVCAKRWLRYGPVTGGPKEAVATVEYFMHGAAIRLPPEFTILLGFRITQSTWRATNPLDHGISKRCGQVALAEAWQGVNMTIDSTTMAAHFRCDWKAWREHKKGVRVRNTIAAVHWDRWNREGLTLEDRTRVLGTYGHQCTAAQLAKFAQDRGL